MMVDVLMQADPLPEFHRALREQFRTGESIYGTLLALLVLAAVVGLAYALTEYQRRRATHAVEFDDPRRLFRDVLRRLDLDPNERQALADMSRELRLGNPTAVLLSETLFDRHLAKWRKRDAQSTGARKSPPSEAATAAIRARLFPAAPSPTATPG